MDKKILVALKYLFATHPSTNVFYTTQDGSAFFDERSADAHAKTTVTKTVTPYTREEIEDLEEPISDEELKEIFDLKRESLESEFEEEFGFAAPENSTDNELAFAIDSLLKYKRDFHKNVLKGIEVITGNQNEGAQLDTSNQEIEDNQPINDSENAGAAGSADAANVEQSAENVEPKKPKKAKEDSKTKPEDQTNNA